MASCTLPPPGSKQGRTQTTRARTQARTWTILNRLAANVFPFYDALSTGGKEAHCIHCIAVPWGTFYSSRSSQTQTHSKVSKTSTYLVWVGYVFGPGMWLSRFHKTGLVHLQHFGPLRFLVLQLRRESKQLVAKLWSTFNHRPLKMTWGQRSFHARYTIWGELLSTQIVQYPVHTQAKPSSSTGKPSKRHSLDRPAAARGARIGLAQILDDL